MNGEPTCFNCSRPMKYTGTERLDDMTVRHLYACECCEDSTADEIENQSTEVQS